MLADQRARVEAPQLRRRMRASDKGHQFVAEQRVEGDAFVGQAGADHDGQLEPPLAEPVEQYPSREAASSTSACTPW
jgi:hypothetical protein